MSPYTIRKRGNNRWAIINKQTGATVGSAATKAKAQASVRARMAAERRRK
jgi:hypothetical protein